MLHIYLFIVHFRLYVPNGMPVIVPVYITQYICKLLARCCVLLLTWTDLVTDYLYSILH